MLYIIIDKALQLNASDIHITVGTNPIARVKGRFVKLSDQILTNEDTKQMVIEIAGQERFKTIQEVGELDFSFSIKDGTRFRVNAYRQNGSYALAIRTINAQIPNFNDLNLPKSLSKLTEKFKGLVLVTGPTGSGKSTTLASLIDIINSTRQEHIITLEDPIEYVHRHKQSIVNQREIGSDSKSFSSALRAILRQDPDVILIGEMRDPETISIALTAAETGHLVFSTLHTVGAAKTIDRIVDMFPPNQQQQIRSQLSTVCEGVISQQLLPTSDGNGRVAAVEVMIANTAIRNLVRENKTYQIPSIIQTSSKQGMQTMDQDIIRLFKEGKISKETALSRCTDFENTSKMLGYNDYYNNIEY